LVTISIKGVSSIKDISMDQTLGQKEFFKFIIDTNDFKQREALKETVQKIIENELYVTIKGIEK